PTSSMPHQPGKFACAACRPPDTGLPTPAGSGWSGGGHQTSGKPGAAPPHPPPQPLAGDVGHAELREVFAILSRGKDVGDHQPATRAQYPHGLPDRSVTARPALYVVDREAGEHHVEAAIRER